VDESGQWENWHSSCRESRVVVGGHFWTGGPFYYHEEFHFLRVELQKSALQSEERGGMCHSLPVIGGMKGIRPTIKRDREGYL
jgi:hypothetical protein